MWSVSFLNLNHSHEALTAERLAHAPRYLRGVLVGVEVREPAADLAVARAHVHQRARVVGAAPRRAEQRARLLRRQHEHGAAA